MGVYRHDVTHRLIIMGAKLTHLADVTPHTLRHTFASVAGDLGFSELTIAALLGQPTHGACSLGRFSLLLQFLPPEMIAL